MTHFCFSYYPARMAALDPLFTGNYCMRYGEASDVCSCASTQILHHCLWMWIDCVSRLRLLNRYRRMCRTSDLWFAHVQQHSPHGGVAYAKITCSSTSRLCLAYKSAFSSFTEVRDPLVTLPPPPNFCPHSSPGWPLTELTVLMMAIA